MTPGPAHSLLNFRNPGCTSLDDALKRGSWPTPGAGPPICKTPRPGDQCTHDAEHFSSPAACEDAWQAYNLLKQAYDEWQNPCDGPDGLHFKLEYACDRPQAPEFPMPPGPEGPGSKPLQRGGFSISMCVGVFYQAGAIGNLSMCVGADKNGVALYAVGSAGVGTGAGAGLPIGVTAGSGSFVDQTGHCEYTDVSGKLGVSGDVNICSTPTGMTVSVNGGPALAIGGGGSAGESFQTKPVYILRW